MPKAPKFRDVLTEKRVSENFKRGENSLGTKLRCNRKAWSTNVVTGTGVQRRPRHPTQKSLSGKLKSRARFINLNRKISSESDLPLPPRANHDVSSIDVSCSSFEAKTPPRFQSHIGVRSNAPTSPSQRLSSCQTVESGAHTTIQAHSGSGWSVDEPRKNPMLATLERNEGARDGPTKSENEKRRAREQKKRQRAARQVRAEEERLQREKEARLEEAESPGPSRFFVRVPLAKISDLSGRSICKNFRKADLDLNDIRTAQLDAVQSSSQAKAVLDCIRSPLYFCEDCKEKLEILKERLGNASVCEKLKIEERLPAEKGWRSRALRVEVADAINQVLQEAGPPHELESSQNSEEKIKSLFKPILRGMGLDDVLVTTGFSWRESIGLRSTIDLGTHVYSPRSDVAIVQVLSKKKAKILVIFEAYSKLGQSVKTPDENRADRVRLLIQGSYISRRDSKPAVVFYLTHDKFMETIIVFSSTSMEEDEKVSYMYYAERLPFYSESTWVDLVCQVVNLVQDRVRD